MLSKDEYIKILLIEDNPPDKKLVEIFLKESSSINNYELFHALSLSEAKEFSEQGSYNIVLLDMSLPDSSGMDTLRLAKELFPKTSIVLLTGTDSEDLGIGSLKEGAQDYLVKGKIDKNSLTRSILHAITRSKLSMDLESAARDLKNSEQRLLLAQEMALLGNIEIQLETAVFNISDQVYDIYQLTDEDDKIKDITSFVKHICDEDRQMVIDQIGNCIQKQEAFSSVYKIYTKDNELKYLRLQGKVIKDESGSRFMGTIQDITDLKRMEAAGQETDQRYKNIVEQSQDALFLFSYEEELIQYNLALCKMLGYETREEFEENGNKSIFVSNEEQEKFQKELEIKGNVVDYELKLIRKDNSTLDCILSATLWKEFDKKVKGFQGIIRDVTDRRRAEKLTQQKKIAERSALMKQQFLAKMSHEIRTPLNVVTGMTFLLNETNLDSKQREYLSALKVSSEILLKIINDILDFSKIDSGKLELEEYPFSIFTMIDELLHTVKFKANQKKISLLKAIDINVPENLMGDSLRLNQILNNLLTNAIKYTEEGEVGIKVKLIEETEDFVVLNFAVHDTGIGIPAEKHKTIFQSFSQASNDTTRLYGGTGLGLSIARELVMLHDSDIELDSEVGKGSVFKFEIKLRKNNATNKDNKIGLLSRANSDENEQIVLLLVEDHKLNQHVATDMLRKYDPNMLVDIADNGQIAVDRIKDNPNKYHIVLMDVSMPVMTGLEATSVIRNELGITKEQLPILAMTAHAFTDEAVKCFNAGMNDFISKPISPEILFEKIHLYLSEKAHLKADNMSATAPHSYPVTFNANGEMDTFKKITNFDQLDRYCSGNIDLKINLLRTLKEELPEDLEHLQSSLNLNDITEVRKGAHKMKMTATYLGLANIVEIALSLEQDIKNKINLHTVNERVNQIIDVCNEALKEVDMELTETKIAKNK